MFIILASDIRMAQGLGVSQLVAKVHPAHAYVTTEGDVVTSRSGNRFHCRGSIDSLRITDGHSAAKKRKRKTVEDRYWWYHRSEYQVLSTSIARRKSDSDSINYDRDESR